MNTSIDKFPAMQLFTDSFIAETVHLTNEAVGIYIRLICFAWTKHGKPFSQPEAYKICQARLDEEKDIIDLVLKEFFQSDSNGYTNKKVLKEYAYLTEKYKVRSEAGRRGGLAKAKNGTLEKELQNQNDLIDVLTDRASSKTIAPTPIPTPIPNKILLADFETFWGSLIFKKGSKKLACQRYCKECREEDPQEIAKLYNKYSASITDKQFCAQVSTWINQRRFEDEINNTPKEIPEPKEFYNGIELKRHGFFGDQIEYVDNNGNKYQKHKWKVGAKIEKVN